MTDLPVRARRAVLLGADIVRQRAAEIDVQTWRAAVRQRAAGIDVSAVRGAVRRRRGEGAEIGPRVDVPAARGAALAEEGAPLTVERLVAGSASEIALAVAATTGPLPEGSRTVDLDGPVHYVEHGDPDAPPVVCVHGLGGSHANWHDLAPLLSAQHRVLAVDLAGHGRTPRAGRSASVRANRLLLSRFLAEVVGRPAVLVGNSMGGTICLLQAAEEPGSVRDLVLIGPAAPRARTELPDLAVARQAAMFAVPGVAEKVLARRRERLGAEGLIREQMQLTTADINRVSQEMRAVAIELVASRAAGPDAEAAFLEAARSLVALLARSARYRQLVADVPGPALVLHGELDRLVPVSCSQALARLRPDWRLEVLDGVGHVPQIEMPELTAAHVLSWLARAPAVVPAQVPQSSDVPDQGRAARG